jgi:aryl carrier-like protein
MVSKIEKSKLAVHISVTPLAGAPADIVRAINLSEGWRAVSFVLYPNAYGPRVYQGSSSVDDNADLLRESVDSAELIHLHHYFDLERNGFGIDFRKVANKRPVVMHFHSHPDFVCRHANVPRADLYRPQLTHAVVAQHQERFYPTATPLRNPIWPESIDLSEAKKASKKIIYFNPTSDVEPYEGRWETKGGKSFVQLLKNSVLPERFELRVFSGNLSYEDALSEIAGADFIIDDLFTGGIHRTSIEGMAYGKTVFCRIDERTKLFYKNSYGQTPPVVVVSANALPRAIEALSNNQTILDRLCIIGKDFFELVYSPVTIMKEYCNFYDSLISGDCRKPDRTTQNILGVGHSLIPEIDELLRGVELDIL